MTLTQKDSIPTFSHYTLVRDELPPYHMDRQCAPPPPPTFRQLCYRGYIKKRGTQCFWQTAHGGRGGTLSLLQWYEKGRKPTAVVGMRVPQQTAHSVNIAALHGQEQGGEPVAAAHVLAGALLQQVGGDVGAAHAGCMVQGCVPREHDLVHHGPLLYQQANALTAAGLDG